MSSIVSALLRQLPWEKIAAWGTGKVVGLIKDRFERGKIKSLPTKELFEVEEDDAEILREINRRIAEAKQ